MKPTTLLTTGMTLLGLVAIVASIGVTISSFVEGGYVFGSIVGALTGGCCLVIISVLWEAYRDDL